MFLLAFHIIVVSMLVVMVGMVSYRMGYQKAERRLQRRQLANRHAGMPAAEQPGD
ncbi:MAG TPA: hypothetical protein VL359_05035 [bacterium]|nr:hypothetical protein [bacterium]